MEALLTQRERQVTFDGSISFDPTYVSALPGPHAVNPVFFGSPWHWGCPPAVVDLGGSPLGTFED